MLVYSDAPYGGFRGALAGPPGRVLTPLFGTALAASIVLHGAVLAMRFGFPDAARLRTPPQTLDVVLVNSRSPTRPVAPDALAQANLDAGGNTDADRRARTPLPVTREVARGDDTKRARKRAEVLEAKQRQLMTQLAQARAAVPAEEAKPAPAPDAPAPLSGADLMNSALALARMEAQIARQVDEYNKRPRKHFVGARAHGSVARTGGARSSASATSTTRRARAAARTEACASPSRSSRTARSTRSRSTGPRSTRSSTRRR